MYVCEHFVLRSPHSKLGNALLVVKQYVIHCAWLSTVHDVSFGVTYHHTQDEYLIYSTATVLDIYIYCLLLIEVDHIGVVGFYRLVSCFSVIITPLLIKYAYIVWVMLIRTFHTVMHFNKQLLGMHYCAVVCIAGL